MNSRTAASSSMTNMHGASAGTSKPVLRAATSTAATRAGRSSAKVVPRPGVLATLMVPPIISGEPLADGQPQPRAAVLAGGAGVRLGERLEQLAHLLRGHADAGVGDGHGHPVAARVAVPPGGQGDGPGVGELVRVREQVEQHLPQLGRVGVHHPDGRRAVHRQGVLLLVHQRPDGVHHLGDGSRQVERLEVQLHLAGLDLGQVEDAVDQAQQVFAGAADLVQVGAELVPPGRCPTPPPGAARST